MVLAARFRKPLPIVLGILAATLANHGIARVLGAWITSVIAPDVLRWMLGISFVAMAAWTLVPDRFEQDSNNATHFGVFCATLIAFFIVEIGDKTQLATIALAAQYHAVPEVVTGTTLGMMIANVPAVLLGERLTQRFPIRGLQICASLTFFALGIAILLGADERFDV